MDNVEQDKCHPESSQSVFGHVLDCKLEHITICFGKLALANSLRDTGSTQRGVLCDERWSVWARSRVHWVVSPQASSVDDPQNFMGAISRDHFELILSVKRKVSVGL